MSSPVHTDRESVSRLVASAIEQTNATLPGAAQLSMAPATLLTGDGGALSSLDLISLILAVEEKVNEAFGTQVLLFDEALIADPNGPFRTVGDLVTHVHALVQKA